MADVRIERLNKAFGSIEILKNIDLSIADGEFLVLVGPSGCGKSTLLRIIAGLEDISTGEILIGGRRVNTLAPAERKIAMVFQSYALYPHKNVRDNMTFGLRFSGMKRDEMDRRVAEAARMLQLEKLLDRKPRDLSGGQRQRVAIGRAIVRQPDVFLFDEPLSNLDAALRVSTRVEIARLHRMLGATMIYVTHDQTEAMTLADRIVVMNNGLIEQVGRPLDLYEKPANIFVAAFIGSPSMNLIPAAVSDRRGEKIIVVSPAARDFAFAGTSIPPSANDKVTIGVRPESLSPGESGDLVVEGTVELVERLGDVSYLYLRRKDQPAGAEPNLVVELRGRSTPRIGEVLQVCAAREDVHLFDAAGQRIAAN